MPYSRRLSNLFPAISPNQSGMMGVGNGHQIYWEECGNSDGVPIVFLHGGPGAGASALHRRFFDPNYYRIILLDQRGCGRSLPTAEIAHNTTQDLISDLESLRSLLKIDRWHVFGGSWGSTLALAYGVTHPTRCLGFILRGIFMGQSYEKEWFINKMGTFFPEEGRAFLNFLSEDERRDVIGSYVKQLNHPNPEVHMPAAFSWAGYEEACATLLPYHGHSDPDPVLMLCLARLEAHYFQHDFFMEDGFLFANLHKIIHLPCIIIQGRYDVICPPKTAEKLARHWPKAQYIVVPDAGHSAMEPGVRGALVNATQAFKSLSR